MTKRLKTACHGLVSNIRSNTGRSSRPETVRMFEEVRQKLRRKEVDQFLAVGRTFQVA
jgi:hypothetical protein